MENETFRTRLFNLLQKSRKAVRLYTSMAGGLNGETPSPLQEEQAAEWKEINSDLLKQLSLALDMPNARQLAASACLLRDHFYSIWRLSESELQIRHGELISAAENSDYMRAASLSRELVVLKARGQAAQAAHHEIDSVISKSKVSVAPVELSKEREVLTPAPKLAKVIPLRRQITA